MAEVKIVYKELEDLSDHARKLKDKCGDYEDELKRKLSDKIPQLPDSPLSSSASRMRTANTYINAKRNALTNKKTNYKNFADSVDELLRNTKAADKAVAKQVNNSKKDFLKEHPNLEGDGWAAFFAAISVEVPVIGWIVDAIHSVVEGGRNLKNTIRRWYEISGGKKIVDTVLAVAGAVLAIVGLVVAVITFPVSGTIGAIVVAAAGLVASAIAVVNAITNVCTQVKANMMKDPAWSQYYGNQNTISDWLRKKTFRGWASGFNKVSMTLAKGIEITNTICSVINIASGISKLYKRSGLQKICGKKITTTVNGTTKTTWKFDFSTAKKTFTTAEGRATLKKVIKANWKGTLFGDKGGLTVWKKQGARAIKAAKSGKYLKLVKFTKDTGDRIVSAIDVSKLFGKGMVYGFNKKDAKSIRKGIYSISGYSGLMSSASKIRKLVS